MSKYKMDSWLLGDIEKPTHCYFRGFGMTTHWGGIRFTNNRTFIFHSVTRLGTYLCIVRHKHAGSIKVIEKKLKPASLCRRTVG